MRKWSVLFLVIIFLLVFVTYERQNENGVIEVRLILSKDFGSEVLYDLTLHIQEGTSVLELTTQNLAVETSYGGKFIKSINGIENSEAAWFYYINEVSAEVGADDYIVKQGDVVKWDYHKWDD